MYGQKFSDVDPTDANHYFAGPIQYAAALGYVAGDAGAFGVGNTISSVGLYSTILSMLGVRKSDIDGVDWENKVGDMINRLGLGAMMVIGNKTTVTRADTALVLNAALDLDMFAWSGSAYVATGAKLLSKFGPKVDANAVKISGKLIKNRFVALEGANGYHHDTAVLWNPGVQGGAGNIYQIVSPPDEALPTKYLGRWVEIDAVRTDVSGASHYRVATGAKANPMHTNDVVPLAGYDNSKTGADQFGAAFTSRTSSVNFSNQWYTWTTATTQQGHNPAMRGAYFNYFSGRNDANGRIGTSKDVTKTDTWQVPNDKDAFDVWNYAYAIRDINVDAFTEVFYLELVAMKVRDISTRGDGVRFDLLDGRKIWGDNWLALSGIEFGSTLKAGDVVVGIKKYNANGDWAGLLSVEVIEAQKGKWCDHVGSYCANVDGAHWVFNGSTFLEGAPRGLKGAKCGLEHSFYNYVPFYGLLTGGSTVNGAFWTDCFGTTLHAVQYEYLWNYVDDVFAVEFVADTNNSKVTNDPGYAKVFAIISNVSTGNISELVGKELKATSGDTYLGAALAYDTAAGAPTKSAWGQIDVDAKLDGLNVATNFGYRIVIVGVDADRFIKAVAWTDEITKSTELALGAFADLNLSTKAPISATITWNDHLVANQEVTGISWARTTGGTAGGTLTDADYFRAGTTLTINGDGIKKITDEAVFNVGDVITFTVAFKGGVSKTAVANVTGVAGENATADITLSATNLEAGGDISSTPIVVAAGEINAVVTATQDSVVFTVAKGTAQVVNLIDAGTGTGTAASAALAPTSNISVTGHLSATFTVSGITSATGSTSTPGEFTFTFTVSEAGKADITYTVILDTTRDQA